jgi:hypothetical protein
VQPRIVLISGEIVHGNAWNALDTSGISPCPVKNKYNFNSQCQDRPVIVGDRRDFKQKYSA